MRTSSIALGSILVLLVTVCLSSEGDAKRRKKPPRKDKPPTTQPVDADGAGGDPGTDGASEGSGDAPAAGGASSADVAPKSPPEAPASSASAASAPSAPAEAPAAAASKSRVVVLPLAGLGLDSDTLSSLEQYLRNSIATIEGTELVNAVDLQMALRKPSNAEVAQCGGGPKCAQLTGGLVQADVVVFGSIGAVGDAFSLNLRALQVQTGKEIAKQRTSIAGTRHLLIPEMRLAAYRLIAPDKIRGSLLVEIDVAGVEVEIDGELVGTTPLAQAVSLTPGSHVVVVKRPGYSSFQQEFEIKPFDTARLRLDLKKAEPAAP